MNQAIILLGIAFVCMLLLVGAYIVDRAYGEEHQINISWKEQQLQEKFNNINMSDYTSFDEQMEKVKRTQDYLKYWGWRQ